MNRVASSCCILAALAGLVACSSEPLQPDPAFDTVPAAPVATEGAAGNPAPTPELEMSAALEDAEPVEALMAQGPAALGVELPPDLEISKKIVGADNRARVANTKVSPYATVATLIVTFPRDPSRPGMCTGSMIAADAVLTAAHCVYDAKLGGWARSMRVIPGAYPNSAGKTQQPFGSASALRAFAPSAYRATTSFWQREPYDYAVVRVGAGFGKAPLTRAFGALSSPKVGRPITLVGYHVDKCAGSAACVPGSSSFIMHKSTDTIRELLPAGAVRSTLFNHYADSMAGASGSPIVADGSFANTIFAVHVAGFRNDATGTWNMGVLLTADAVTNIKSWAGRKL